MELEFVSLLTGVVLHTLGEGGTHCLVLGVSLLDILDVTGETVALGGVVDIDVGEVEVALFSGTHALIGLGKRLAGRGSGVKLHPHIDPGKGSVEADDAILVVVIAEGIGTGGDGDRPTLSPHREEVVVGPLGGTGFLSIALPSRGGVVVDETLVDRLLGGSLGDGSGELTVGEIGEEDQSLWSRGLIDQEGDIVLAVPQLGAGLDTGLIGVGLSAILDPGGDVEGKDTDRRGVALLILGEGSECSTLHHLRDVDGDLCLLLTERAGSDLGAPPVVGVEVLGSLITAAGGRQ